MPRVSVIIPNYNHAPFLQQRIASVLNQNFQDFEVILLDDCSTDDSRVILEKYRHAPQVSHLIYNEKNSGSTFLQWEKGFELATGEYIWIAESDDYCELSFLEKLVSALDSYTNAGVAYCQSFRVNENGNEINDFRQWKDKDWPELFYIEGKEMALEHFLNGRAIPNASTALFRKSVIPKSDYFTTFKYSGDIIFWLGILSQSGIAVVNERLNYFRKHEKNVSGKASKNGLDIQEGIKILDFVRSKWLIPENYLLSYKMRMTEILWTNYVHPNAWRNSISSNTLILYWKWDWTFPLSLLKVIIKRLNSKR